MRGKFTVVAKLLFLLATGSVQTGFAQHKADYLIAFTDTGSGGELTGFRFPDGRIAFTPQFQMCTTDTFRRMAIVLKRDHWVCIDRSGNELFRPFIFDNGPDYFEEGLFRFLDQNNKLGFADADGRIVIPARFDFAEPMKDGIVEYVIGGHKQYEHPGGEHWSWQGGKTGYTNRKGQEFSRLGQWHGRYRDAWTMEHQKVRLDKKGALYTSR